MNKARHLPGFVFLDLPLFGHNSRWPDALNRAVIRRLPAVQHLRSQPHGIQTGAVEAGGRAMAVAADRRDGERRRSVMGNRATTRHRNRLKGWISGSSSKSHVRVGAPQKDADRGYPPTLVRPYDGLSGAKW